MAMQIPFGGEMSQIFKTLADIVKLSRILSDMPHMDPIKIRIELYASLNFKSRSQAL
jgi:hypothetical protein